MSYILFSQTSTADGTRNLWNAAGMGQSTTASQINVGVANGTVLSGIANSTFSEAAIRGTLNAGNGYDMIGPGAAPSWAIDSNNKAFFDLSSAGGPGYTMDSAVLARLGQVGGPVSAATGNVLNSSGTFAGVAANASQANAALANDRTLTADSGYDIGAKTLTVALNDLNWNDIKNVEVMLSSAETGTGFTKLSLQAFVDARVKVGDSDCVNAKGAGVERFAVEILDGKRGQVDASQSDMAVDVKIDVWTNNGGWQNSFANQGSNFDDTFDINFGQLAVRRGISEFGLGAGQLVDDDRVFDATADLTQSSAYNGHLTTLLTNMGLGDDRYDATTGISVTNGVATITSSLATIDWVWGGSGDDVIRTGANADFLFGDFGAAVSGGQTIGQFADTSSLNLSIGGSGNIEDWVVGTGVTIFGRPLAANDETLSPTLFSVSGSNLASRAFFEVKQSDSAQDAATWSTKSSGIGISLTRDGQAPTGTEANPEINADAGDDGGVSDVVAIGLGRDASAAKFTLSLFYSADGGSRDIETALITVGNDTDKDGDIDVVVGSFVLRADGSVGSIAGLSSASGTAAVAGGEGYAANRPGLVSGSFAAGASFDMIEFRSAGLVDKSGSVYTATNHNDVSDFFLRDLCFTVAGFEGNDILEAGAGRDLLMGGGDMASVTAGPSTSATLIVNGGFETVALNAAQQEGGAWYLTGGTPAAGAGFGWSIAPTVLRFDDIPLPDAPLAEARIPNGYGGFAWKQAGVFDTDPALGGYTASSGVQIGFIAEAGNIEITGYEDTAAGTPLTFSRTTPFDLLSARFSAAFRDDLAITAKAFDAANVQIGSKTFEADMGSTALVDFTMGVTGSFAGAVRIEINANDGNAATSDYFGLDDLTFRGHNIEIQNNGTGGLNPFEGSYKLELDAHPGEAAASVPMQSFATIAGLSYTARFAFAERQGTGDGSSDFQVLWDGDVVGTFTNPAGTPNWAWTAANGATIAVSPGSGGWSTATITGLVGDGADSLAFRNLDGQINTYGAFLDAVSVTGADVQSLTVRGGDRLFPGGADNARDTIVYEAGDGFDLVFGYDRSATGTTNDDVIDLNGVTVASGAQAVVNGDLGWLLTMNDGGRIFVAGVTNGTDLLFI